MESQKSFNLIKREYITGRLIGYLENYRYLQHAVQDVGNQQNILYLYGDIDSNESFYTDLRKNISSSDRVILYYSFADGDGTLGVETFLNEIKKTNKDVDFAYTDYYLELISAAEEEAKTSSRAVNLVELAKYGLALINPDPFAKVDLAINIAEKAGALVSELKKKLNASAKKAALADPEDEERDLSNIATPLIFLRYDLERLTRENPDKQIVFLTNGLETYDEKLRKTARTNDHMDIEQWMDLMEMSKDVVWILLNRQMPDARVRRKIALENIWQIEHIDRKEAIEYLRANLENEQEEWIQKAYEETGGQRKLMDYCIRYRLEEKSSGHGRFGEEDDTEDEIQDYREMLDEYMGKREAEKSEEKRIKLDKKIHSLQKHLDSLLCKQISMSEKEIGLWFQNLWKGKLAGTLSEEGPPRGCIPNITEEDPLWQIFPEVVLAYWTDGCQPVEQDKMLLPCICYLVWDKEQTRNKDWLLGIRTNNQLGIGRTENVIRAIYETGCFSEYSEYEHTYYVREEIAHILKRHQNFEKWSELFRRTFVDQLLPDKNELTEDIKLSDNGNVSEFVHDEMENKDDLSAPANDVNERILGEMRTVETTAEKAVLKLDQEETPEDGTAPETEREELVNEAKIRQDISERNEKIHHHGNRLAGSGDLNDVDKNVLIEDNINNSGLNKIF